MKQGRFFSYLTSSSTQAQPEVQTSGVAEDLDKLTALSSLVSTLVQKEEDAEKMWISYQDGKAACYICGGLIVPAGATTGSSADPSNKDKSPLLEEDPPVKERTFRQREEDRLDSDWTNIMGQVHANQGLTADRLGPDVNEDNFAERMVALIAKRRRGFAAQRISGQEAPYFIIQDRHEHVKSFSDDQLKTEFDKIRTATAELQSLNIRRSLKRPGADLEQASSKKSKPTEAPKSSVPDESQQPSAEPRTHSYGTRRKSLGARKKSSTELDLTADDRSFIRVLFDDSDDSNDDDDTPIIWSAFAAWEVVPTGLGDVKALYFMDKSSKYFTHLREILHLVDRKDLFKLYGMVVQYYEEHPLAGYGMILWGDLQVLFESHKGGNGAGVWADQQQWVIQSWSSTHKEDVEAINWKVEIGWDWDMI
ncbi:hypothetical protein Tco_1219081 [Tanacetum coccineum]